MKAALLTGIKDIEIIEEKKPVIRDDKDVIIQIKQSVFADRMCTIMLMVKLVTR